MQNPSDFERDRDRREGFRGNRDEGRFERGRERMEPDELQHHGREHGDFERSHTGGDSGEHQQYSQTYGNPQGMGSAGSQGQYGQGQYGQGQYGQGQYGQGQYGQGQYGGQYGDGRSGMQGGQGFGAGRFGSASERGGNEQPTTGSWGQREESRGMTGRSATDEGRTRGRFRGKGPKDWVRSDERIREEVCELLADSDDVDASGITVKVESGEVTLDGAVDSRQAKREAEEVACRARGVKDCLNHLRVKSETSEISTGRGKEAGNGHQAQPGRTSAAMTSRPST
jgi:osmotically-inducible protein OsmY